MNIGLLNEPSKFKINEERAVDFFYRKSKERCCVVVKNQKISFANFSELDVSSVVFKNCTFHYCLFKNIYETVFECCSFYDCDFTNSTHLFVVQFEGCHLIQCNFSNMVISSIEFKRSFFNEVVFYKTRLTNSYSVFERNLCYRTDFTGITGTGQLARIAFENNTLLESKVLYWEILENIYNVLVDTSVLGIPFSDTNALHFVSNSLQTILEVVLDSNMFKKKGLVNRVVYLDKTEEKKNREKFEKLLEITKKEKELLYEKDYVRYY